LVFLDEEGASLQYLANGQRRVDRPCTGRWHALSPVVVPVRGFMPTDPRHSVVICAALGVVKDPSMMFSARGRWTARARGRSSPRPSSRMVSGRPRGPGDAAADAHRGSEHCVHGVYDARRGLHVPRYVESDWLAGVGRCARGRRRGDLSFDWTNGILPPPLYAASRAHLYPAPSTMGLTVHRSISTPL
jgi:hypothetical protein